MANQPQTEQQRILRISASLKSQRSAFDPHWQDIASLTFPRRVRFAQTDRNKSNTSYWTKIVHGRGTLAARTARSGMMSGLSSPARPWRKITTIDQDLAKYGPVKTWLFELNKRVNSFTSRSNFYKVMPTLYGDVVNFATACVGVLPDNEAPYRFYDFPVGSYWLGCNARGVVDTFLREFQMTVKSVVEKFGDNQEPDKIKWDKFTPGIKAAYNQSDYERPVTVEHYIGFNPEYDPTVLSDKRKRFVSYYYERGMQAYPGQLSDAGITMNKFLSVSGYDLFPILAPRWDTTGEDTYGTSCPGMEMLGDLKELQMLTKKKSKGLDKQLDPPLTGPVALRNQKVSLLSGDITYGDVRQGTLGLRPIHETAFSHADVREDMNVLEQRINEYYYVDLFQMLRNMEGVQPRNEKELAMRNEEKLLELGPVVERLQDELFDPETALEVHYLDQAGLLPPRPQELRNSPLMVEYVSVMAQAQKLVGVAGTERFLGFVGNMSGMFPEVKYKVNSFAAVNEYADMMGVPENITVEDDAAQAKVDAEMQAKQQAAQAEQMQATAAAAKQLSDADTSTDNMLTRLMAGA